MIVSMRELEKEERDKKESKAKKKKIIEKTIEENKIQEELKLNKMMHERQHAEVSSTNYGVMCMYI